MTAMDQPPDIALYARAPRKPSVQVMKLDASALAPARSATNVQLHEPARLVRRDIPSFVQSRRGEELAHKQTAQKCEQSGADSRVGKRVRQEDDQTLLGRSKGQLMRVDGGRWRLLVGAIVRLVRAGW